MRALELVASRLSRPPSSAGRGQIAIARVGGGSVVTRAFARSPLRLLTPRNHGQAAWVYASSYGGGLVDGDRVDLEIDVAAGASAFVSTQASTKVYRGTCGSRTATRVRVGAGGLLVLAPDPIVCYAGARYRQTQGVDVDRDGGLVLVDWLTSGRRAAGEHWRFDEYDARTEVRVGSMLVMHDRLRLRAADGELGTRLGRVNVFALVVVAGGGVADEAEEMLAGVAARPLERRPPLLLSGAPLRGGGCAIRLAGQSVEQVGDVISRLLAFVPRRLGDDPWSRKW